MGDNGHRDGRELYVTTWSIIPPRSAPLRVVHYVRRVVHDARRVVYDAMRVAVYYVWSQEDELRKP